jgi:squalene-hopene/tetraprenyl-beta-curcumene cyclase
MLSLCVAHLLVALAIATPPELPLEGDLPEGRVHHAVEASTRFLEKEGLRWMKQQQCASCHHIPAMVWALNEARGHGYQVNEKALAEVTSWALAEGSQAQVFPDLPLDKKHSETDYLGPLLMALGVGAGEMRDATVEKDRRRLLARALTQQAKDGSWNANSGGRPPVHASRDVQTSWILLAMSDASLANSSEDQWVVQRNAATEWLTRNPPADSHQGLAMRLLVHRRLGKPAAEVQPLVDALLRQQNEDGGWSQTQKMKSDAFATGLSLYVLSGQKAPGLDVAVRRAEEFLVQTQQPDGSWTMTSRPAGPKGPGPAHDLRPIQYFGTAWAMIGLVRSCPATGAADPALPSRGAAP